MLSPSINLTVSLAFTGVATSLLACNLNVWFCNAVMLPALVATFAKLSFASCVKSTLYVVMFVAASLVPWSTTTGEPVSCTTFVPSAVTLYTLWPSAVCSVSSIVTLLPALTSVFAAAAAVCTSPIFAALVTVVPPLATLAICLPPALTPPVFVILGPPLIVKPSLFKVLSPAFTLVNSTLSLVATVITLPFWVVVKFLPASTVTFPPALIFAVLVFSLPLFALARVKLAALIAPATCSAVANTSPVALGATLPSCPADKVAVFTE